MLQRPLTALAGRLDLLVTHVSRNRRKERGKAALEVAQQPVSEIPAKLLSKLLNREGCTQERDERHTGN